MFIYIYIYIYMFFFIYIYTYMNILCVCIYIYIYIYTHPSTTSRMQHKLNFYAEFNRFDFWVFFLLNQLQYQSWRTLSALLFTWSRREKNWIHMFHTTKWNNINSLIQELNSGRCVHFLWWYPLHHKYIYIYIGICGVMDAYTYRNKIM